MDDHAQHRPRREDASASEEGREPTRSFWRSTAGLVTIAFLAIGAFFLLAEHRAHLIGWLPWLLLLASPLLHFLMHRGHGGHGAGGDSSSGKRPHRH